MSPLATTIPAPPRPKVVPERHPRIAHFLPYLLGDSLRALALAIRLGYHYIDLNIRVDGQGRVWVLHWRRSNREWRWRWIGERTERGREIRVRNNDRRPIEQLTTAEVSRLRARRFGGRRPRKLMTYMLRARKHDLTLCLEAKNSPAFQRPEVWKRIATMASVTGCLVIVMTLQRPGEPAHRAFKILKNATRVGFPVALLPRGPKPSDWESVWMPLGVQKWGRWR